MNLRRRHLLGTALAAQLTAPLLPATPASAATRFDPNAVRFTLAVLPDTQYLFDADSADPEPLRATFRWLTEHRGSANIAFLTHLGDITEHGTADELARADATFRRIDGRLPYSVLAGNHDVRSSSDDQRGDSAYLRTFGPHRFAAVPTYGGASPDGYHSFHVITAGGRQWLILALDWRASDKGLAWVQGVLDRHRRLPAILTTHELAAADQVGVARLSAYGQRLWDALIRRNDQIFLTLNGHYWPPGRTVLRNDAGHDVHVHVTNYQDRYYGGAAMIRLYHVDLARNVIDVETFAPYLDSRDDRLAMENRELTSDVDRFSIAIDYAARFAGFAPSSAPPPRPASAVIPRGTVAYWRFDDAGFDDTRARDLTGGGNDLTLTRLPFGAPAARTDDHHRDQPAHASLRFDNGTILRTGPAAPLNRATFQQGYTIELFLKLPDPFVGDHAWMGIFSWEGRSADTGRTSGDPAEPTCSLNLSPERFLQYVVYPTGTDDVPTSWSHTVPLGRWIHVAVVNDAHHTTVYVDGSPIVRNPTRPSRGITTLGKPFVLGGTQYAEDYDRAFYGWLGDVRIVSRPLRPQDFLSKP
ncbi:LamG-like jellyroll fold domain-containing protein [Actinoplanes xinjiangensis]|uniref:LamG-like jellyroll fold domain-containing protein n=1 Tax=Actinoplanes xinjiangensis TaxID=512350 RepID=UPI003414354A